MAHPPPPPDSGDDLRGGVAHGQDAGTPRWVKVSGIVAAVLFVLAVAVMVVSGGHHGPGRHMPPGGMGDRTPSGPVEERGTADGSGAPTPFGDEV